MPTGPIYLQMFVHKCDFFCYVVLTQSREFGQKMGGLLEETACNDRANNDKIDTARDR